MKNLPITDYRLPITDYQPDSRRFFRRFFRTYRLHR